MKPPFYKRAAGAKPLFSFHIIAGITLPDGTTTQHDFEEVAADNIHEAQAAVGYSLTQYMVHNVGLTQAQAFWCATNAVLTVSSETPTVTPQDVIAAYNADYRAMQPDETLHRFAVRVIRGYATGCLRTQLLARTYLKIYGDGATPNPN